MHLPRRNTANEVPTKIIENSVLSKTEAHPEVWKMIEDLTFTTAFPRQR
jgi:hypothetical protein